MQHGAQGYFDERMQFERRVTAVTTAVSLAFMTALLLVVTVPPLHDLLPAPERFGFEGPDQYVRRIMIESQPTARPPSPLLNYHVQLDAVKGGRSATRASRNPRAIPETRRRGFGPGANEEDFLARARTLFPRSLVVQSEELIVERLVRPDYPAEAQAKNIEGTVAVVAQLDTLGGIMDVEVVGGTREPLLEDAVTVAVQQCMFRPYRVDGAPREVAVLFRFRFQLQ